LHLRKFIDLHLRPPSSDHELDRMIRFARNSGFNGVAVTSYDAASETLRTLSDKLDFQLIHRVDLRPRRPRELTASLRRLRRRFELIAVECLSKSVARQAAKDHRVDVLFFPASPSARSKVWFDRHEAVLASGANCSYEINMSDILSLGPAAGAKLLAIMRREVENAMKYEVPMVLSSGADSLLFMRTPRELAAMLDLMDVDEEKGLEMISSIPGRIVESNRSKLSQGFITSDVRVVGRNEGQ